VRYMNNKDRYIEWLESGRFKQRITWVEYDLLAYQVIKEYKTKEGHKVEEWLKDSYSDMYIDYDGTYKIECMTIGKLALKMLKKESDWNSYNVDAEFLELFKRCLLFDFKNSRIVKIYMRDRV